MNYGYATDDPLLGALEEDKVERYPLQMYRRLVASLPVSLADQRLLEVGSGRGGGLAHLAKTQADGGEPLSQAVGGDLCSQQIALCTKRFAGVAEGLSYVQADAENLPFDDASFDVVLNVESSHCYPHIDRFLSEVRRVLARGGCFGIVDFRKVDDGKMAAFEEKVRPDAAAAAPDAPDAHRGCCSSTRSVGCPCWRTSTSHLTSSNLASSTTSGGSSSLRATCTRRCARRSSTSPGSRTANRASTRTS